MYIMQFIIETTSTENECLKFWDKNNSKSSKSFWNKMELNAWSSNSVRFLYSKYINVKYFGILKKKWYKMKTMRLVLLRANAMWMKNGRKTTCRQVLLQHYASIMLCWYHDNLCKLILDAFVFLVVSICNYLNLLGYHLFPPVYFWLIYS